MSLLSGRPVTTERSGLFRLVVQNRLNLLHDLWRQLLNQLDGAHVVFDLLNLGRAEDDGADVGVLGAPCQTVFLKNV